MAGGDDLDSMQVFTNIFAKEADGVWRLVHHQAGPGKGLPSEEDDADKLADVLAAAAALKGPGSSDGEGGAVAKPRIAMDEVARL